MAYTRQNYLEDCYTAEHGGTNEAVNAKIRKEIYEREGGNRIPLAFPQYRSLDDYEYYEEREKEISNKGFLERTAEGIMGLVEAIWSLIQFLLFMAAIIFGAYWAFRLLKLILDFLFG